MSMNTQYAIKRVDDWFWNGKLHRNEILSKLESKSIGHQWLVCPFAEADRAISGEDFIKYPELFEQQDQLARDCRNERRTILKNIRKPLLHELGKYLAGSCIIFLAAGNIFVRKFFPNSVGQGISTTMMYFLMVPWSVGGFGLLFLIIGRLQYNYVIYKTLQQNNLLDRQIRLRMNNHEVTDGNLATEPAAT